MSAIQPILKSFCYSCGEYLPKPKTCSRCKQVFYCNVECQAAHWNTHKSMCKRSVKPLKVQAAKHFERDLPYFDMAVLTSDEWRGPKHHLVTRLQQLRASNQANDMFDAIPRALKYPDHPYHMVTLSVLQDILNDWSDQDYIEGTPNYKLHDDVEYLEGHGDLDHQLVREAPSKLRALIRAANKALVMGLIKPEQGSSLRGLVRSPLYDRQILNQTLNPFLRSSPVA